MDIQQLVEEVASRVRQQLASELVPVAQQEKPQRQVLLVSRNASSPMVCGLGSAQGCQVRSICDGAVLQEQTQAILVEGLSVLDLLKIATGIPADAYTETVIRALLTGVPVLIHTESCEAVPGGVGRYGTMVREKKRFLEECGVRFLSETAIGQALQPQPMAEPPQKERKKQSAASGKKRLITESTIREAVRQGIKELEIDSRTIVTDLAREYAAKQKVALRCSS